MYFKLVLEEIGVETFADKYMHSYFTSETNLPQLNFYFTPVQAATLNANMSEEYGLNCGRLVSDVKYCL